jgi:murein DD-endopeptidase MepM/ murein hydrolase activator NlpD
MKRLAIAVGAASLALSTPAAAAPSGELLERGREATRLLLAEDADALAARMSPAFLAQIGGVEGVRKFLAAVVAQAGTERAVLSEDAFHEARVTSYYRRSRFEKMPDVTTVWVIDDKGTIEAGSVRPTQSPAPSDHLDYRTKAKLRLPFAAPTEGRWYVGWGGRDLVHNYHAAVPDQRFAYDLYISRDGMPYRTDGKANEDYYCFGQPILAPAPGKVVEAVDGLPDNPPGTMDRDHPVGNHVVIDHGQGEFSFLAHMQKGSVLPRNGDQVEAGEQIGRCGNSGNTSMPHLHYHLQTTAVFAKGEGLPAQFNGYTANGVPVERGEPVRGEFLEP